MAMDNTRIILLNPLFDEDAVDPLKNRLYKCPKCDRFFRHIGPLKCHYGKSHGKSESPVCIIDSSLICNVCNKSFSQRYDLTIHYRKWHLNEKSDESKVYTCEVCNKEFSWKSALDNHYHKHGERSKESYQCSVCIETFYNLELFEIHCRTHTNAKSDPCGRCQKLPNDFHQSCSCTGKPLNSEIGKTPVSVKDLQAFNVTLEKPLQCEVCFRKFCTKANLRKHSVVHSNEKPHQCEVCSRAFKKRGNLKAHYAIHTKEKNFQCDACGKLFSRKNVLKTHYRIHSEVKPYVCQECNKSFTQLGKLQTHYFTHTQEKPFQCEICNKCFSQKSNLKKHYLTHQKQN